jgi:hypothetical protein
MKNLKLDIPGYGVLLSCSASRTSALEMQAVCSSETFVPIYRTSHLNSENSDSSFSRTHEQVFVQIDSHNLEIINSTKQIVGTLELDKV